jgi:hypothetical protein
MKLSDIKWWHWTLATIAIAIAIRLATGGPLPFLAPSPTGAGTAPSPTGRPARAPNTGPSITEAVKAPGLAVDRATPELNRLTIEASLAGAAKPTALLDQTGRLVREVARALQAGVSEDSTAITQVRILVATRGADRTGNVEAHLALYAIDIPVSALFALSPDKATDAQALGLVTRIVFDDAAAHQAARDWCKSSDNLNQATAFCGRVMAAKGV